MADPIVFPGTVEWSGENPGISLKQQPDGPFTTLASFFRVVLSPHGRGHAMVLMQSPQEAKPSADRANLCLTDNEPLARYLVADFVANFGAFKNLPGLQGLTYRKLDSVDASGDPSSSYGETVKASDINVQLTWSGLGKPFCFALPPDKSATGHHPMQSCSSAVRMPPSRVNGRVLPGKPIPPRRRRPKHRHRDAGTSNWIGRVMGTGAFQRRRGLAPSVFHPAKTGCQASPSIETGRTGHSGSATQTVDFSSEMPHHRRPKTA